MLYPLKVRPVGVYGVAAWVAAAAIVLGAGAATVSASPGLRAHAAAALNGSANCYAHYVRASGSTLLEEGRCAGPLSGSIRAYLHVEAAFSGTFIFYTRYGEIKGYGTARPHGSGHYESFAGTLVATGGSGRYTHAHGRSGLYGVFDRETYGLTAQTRGTLYY